MSMRTSLPVHFFFFFNDPAPTEIYPLSLHAALPIFPVDWVAAAVAVLPCDSGMVAAPAGLIRGTSPAVVSSRARTTPRATTMVRPAGVPPAQIGRAHV